MTLRRTSSAAALAIASALVLAACGSDDSGDGDSITIGIKFDQPGIGLETPDGDYVGFDVDVATYVAKELGYDEDQIVWKQSPSPDRENMLVNGDVDMIFASYSISDERREIIDFAGPYFADQQDLLIRADEEVTDPDEINNMTLCSVTGSTSAENVKEVFAPEAKLQTYGGYSECLTGLENGAVDALTTDAVILAGYAAQEEHVGKFKVAGLELSPEFYGVGLPKDSDLRDDVNTALKKMQDEGAWEKALEDNVGDAEYTWQPAPEITETN